MERSTIKLTKLALQGLALASVATSALAVNIGANNGVVESFNFSDIDLSLDTANQIDFQDNAASDTVVVNQATDTNGANFNTVTAVTTAGNQFNTLQISADVELTGTVGVSGTALNTVKIDTGKTLTVSNVVDDAIVTKTLDVDGTLSFNAGSSSAAADVATTITNFADGSKLEVALGSNNVGTANIDASATLGVDAGTLVNLTTTATGRPLTTQTEYLLVTGPGGGVSDLTAAPTVNGVTTSPLITVAQNTANDDNLGIFVTRNTIASVVTDANGKATADIIDGILDDARAMGGASLVEGTEQIAVNGLLLGATTVEALIDALTQVYHEPTGENLQAGISQSIQVSDQIGIHLAELRQDERTGMAAGDHWNGWGFWARAFGQTADHDRRQGIDGYDSDTYGGAIGLDTMIGEGYRIGAAFSYANTDANSKGAGRTDVDVDSFQFTLYGDFHCRDFFLDWLMAYAFNDYEQVRYLPGSVVARADYDANQYSAKVRAGRVFEWGEWEFTPMASLFYSHLDIDGYTERDAGVFNQVVTSQDYDFLQGAVGFMLAYPMVDDIRVITPEIHANALYDFVGDEVNVTSNFTGAGASTFNLVGFNPEQFSVNVGAGLTVKGRDGLSLSAVYDYETKTDYEAHSGMLTLRLDY